MLATALSPHSTACGGRQRSGIPTRSGVGHNSHDEPASMFLSVGASWTVNWCLSAYIQNYPFVLMCCDCFSLSVIVILLSPYCTSMNCLFEDCLYALPPLGFAEHLWNEMRVGINLIPSKLPSKKICHQPSPTRGPRVTSPYFATHILHRPNAAFMWASGPAPLPSSGTSMLHAPLPPAHAILTSTPCR